MSEYISPLHVRVRRLQAKIDKTNARLNAMEKLQDTIVQSFRAGDITQVEADIALMVHKKIRSGVYKKGKELNVAMMALREESVNVS